MRILNLLLAPLLVLTFLGCSHTLSFRKIEEEHRYPISSQEDSSLDLKCNGPDRLGILQVDAQKKEIHIWRTYKKIWGERHFNEYNAAYDICLKPVVTAICTGFLGAIFWEHLLRPESDRPDHDGNGSYDVDEYLLDIVAHFNPFEAGPIRTKLSKKEKLLIVSTKGKGRDGEERETKSKPLVDCEVEVKLASGSSRAFTSARTTRKGKARIDLVPSLRSALGEDVSLKVTVQSGGMKVTRKLNPIAAFQACELYRNRFGSRTFKILPAQQRDRICGLYEEELHKVLAAGKMDKALAIGTILVRDLPVAMELRKKISLHFQDRLSRRLASGKKEDALAIGQNMLSLFPTDKTVQGQVGRIHVDHFLELWKKGDFGNALILTRTIFRIFPGRSDIRQKVMKSFLERMKELADKGDLNGALALVKRVNPLFHREAEWKNYKDTLELQRVDHLWQQNKHGLALAAGNALLRESPKDFKLREKVADLYERRLQMLMEEGNNREALSLAKSGKRLFPKLPIWTGKLKTLYMCRIQELLAQGEDAAAFAEGRAFVKAYPTDLAGHNLLAGDFHRYVKMKQNKGLLQKALGLAKRGQRLFKGDESWRRTVISLELAGMDYLWSQGKFDQALTDGRRLVAAWPGEKELRIKVATLHRQRFLNLKKSGDLERALALGGRIYRSFPEKKEWLAEIAAVHMARVEELWSQGEHDKALAEGRLLLRNLPEDRKHKDRVTALHMQRFKELKNLQEYAKALVLIKKVQSLLPQDDEILVCRYVIHEALVMSLWEKGSYDKALQEGMVLRKFYSQESTSQDSEWDEWNETIGSLHRKRFLRLKDEGALTEAVKIGMAIKRYFPEKKEWVQDAAALHMSQMEQLWAGGKYDEALQEGSLILRTWPINPKRRDRVYTLHRERIAEFIAGSEYSKALSLLKNIRPLPSGDGDLKRLRLTIHEGLVMASWKKGARDRALKEGRAFLRAHREEKEFREKIAALHWQRFLQLKDGGELKKALAVGKLIRNLFPEKQAWLQGVATAHLERVQALWKKESIPAALSAARALLAYAPKGSEIPGKILAIVQNRVESLSAKGKAREALSLALEGMRLFPKEKDWNGRVIALNGVLVQSLWDQGKQEGALLEGVKLIKKYPNAQSQRKQLENLFSRHFKSLMATNAVDKALSMAHKVLPALSGKHPLAQKIHDLYKKEIHRILADGNSRKALPVIVDATEMFPQDKTLLKEVQAYLDKRKRAIPLAEAIQVGLVSSQVRGSSIRSVSLSVERRVPLSFTVLIPPGTFYVCRGNAQNMVGTETRRVKLSSGKRHRVSIPAACANRTRAIPKGNSSFTVRSSPYAAELTRLAPLLAGQAFSVKQAAVWIVTDNASRSDLGILVSRNMYNAFSRGTPLIRDSHVLKAAKLLRKSGIRLEGKRIWRWLKNKEK